MKSNHLFLPVGQRFWVATLASIVCLAALTLFIPISARAGSATWNLAPGSGDWNTATNWTPNNVPNGSTDTATFALTTVPNVSISAVTEVDGITFTAAASNSYTITATPGIVLTLSGTGITNNSGITQHFLTPTTGAGSFGAFRFTNNATAGSMTDFTNNGASVTVVNDGLGGLMVFLDNSNAGSATISNKGAVPNGVNGGLAIFRDGSSAASATITNFGTSVNGGFGGSAQFVGNATAGSALIDNSGGTGVGGGGGFTLFNNSATAGSATIRNTGAGAVGAGVGFTVFADTSSAGAATIINFGDTGALIVGGETTFQNSATASSANITTNGGTVSGAEGGKTRFLDTATAANATFTTNGGTVSGGGAGNTEFRNTSTAGNGTFTTNGGAILGAFGGHTNFFDTATASNGTFTTNGGAISGASGGFTEFLNTSTAGNGTFTTNGGAILGAFGGTTEFHDTATAGNAVLIANGGTAGGNGGRILFFGASTGGTATVKVFGNGNLDISSHGAPGVTIGSLEGSGNVFLGSNQLKVGSNDLSTTFSGVIQDGGGIGAGTGGSLAKIGSGTLTLTNNNTYSGGTVVFDNGTLVADSLNALGTGDVTLFFGPATLQTRDNAPRTFNVGGNFFDTAGILRIQIGGTNSGVNSDLMAVTQAADLGMFNASALVLHRINNYMPMNGDTVTIITAGGGVNGTFNSVSSDFMGLLQPTIIYNPNDVMVEFALSSSFHSQALTPNQSAVGGELDEVANDPRAAALIGFLGNEPIGNLPHDYDLIAPEELASIYEIGFSQAVVQNMNLQHRMDDIRAGSNGFCSNGFQMQQTAGYSKGSDGKATLDKNPTPALVPSAENRWGVFVTGSGDFVNVGNNDGNAHGYDITTGNVTVGADYRLCDHFAIGIDGGYSGSTADLVDSGRVEVDGGKAGAYATLYGYKILGSLVHVDGAVSGGWNSYDTRRTGLDKATLFVYDDTARGSTNGSEFNALLAYGGDWHFGCLLLGTWSSIQYTNVSIDRFTETGSFAPLQIQNQDQYSLRGTSGVRVAYDLKCGRTIFRPEVRAAWQHESGDRAYPIDARFASGAGDVFTVHGPAIGRDSALVDAGFAVQWSPRCSTYVYYDGVLGRSNYDNNAVSGGFRISF